MRQLQLTKRETDVMLLVAEGLTSPQIATRLTLQPVTVVSYLRNIYTKLDVTTRTGALRKALELHLIELPQQI